jgi:hypothetical protein
MTERTSKSFTMPTLPPMPGGGGTVTSDLATVMVVAVSEYGIDVPVEVRNAAAALESAQSVLDQLRESEPEDSSDLTTAISNRVAFEQRHSAELNLANSACSDAAATLISRLYDALPAFELSFIPIYAERVDAILPLLAVLEPLRTITKDYVFAGPNAATYDTPAILASDEASTAYRGALAIAADLDTLSGVRDAFTNLLGPAPELSRYEPRLERPSRLLRIEVGYSPIEVIAACRVKEDRVARYAALAALEHVTMAWTDRAGQEATQIRLLPVARAFSG